MTHVIDRKWIFMERVNLYRLCLLPIPFDVSKIICLNLMDCNLNLVHLVSNVSVFRSWVLYFFLYFCIVSSPSRVTVVSCSFSYDTYTCTSCLHTSSFPYTDLAGDTIWHFDLGSSLWCKYEFFLLLLLRYCYLFSVLF